MKEVEIHYKTYPRITFGSEFIQLPTHAHIGYSCENHKQANGIFETVLETRLPLFPSLSGSFRHFSASRSRVFTKRSPASHHSFFLALIQYLLLLSKDQRPLFQTYSPQTKNYNTALFVSTFYLKPISVAPGCSGLAYS